MSDIDTVSLYLKLVDEAEEVGLTLSCGAPNKDERGEFRLMQDDISKGGASFQELKEVSTFLMGYRWSRDAGRFVKGGFGHVVPSGLEKA